MLIFYFSLFHRRFLDTKRNKFPPYTGEFVLSKLQLDYDSTVTYKYKMLCFDRSDPNRIIEVDEQIYNIEGVSNSKDECLRILRVDESHLLESKLLFTRL